MGYIPCITESNTSKYYSMRQMKMDGLNAIPIDYDAYNIPASVKEFRPLLFKDGDQYCAILGSDLQTGVLGCGKTAILALAEWNNELQKRAQLPADDNELTNYIKDTLAASKWRIW